MEPKYWKVETEKHICFPNSYAELIERIRKFVETGEQIKRIEEDNGKRLKLLEALYGVPSWND